CRFTVPRFVPGPRGGVRALWSWPLSGSTAAPGPPAASQPASPEPPPETTTIRLPISPNACLAPQPVAEELLRAEGFTDVQYVETGLPASYSDAVSAGQVDLMQDAGLTQLLKIDEGKPVVILSGIHGGGYKPLANEGRRRI